MTPVVAVRSPSGNFFPTFGLAEARARRSWKLFVFCSLYSSSKYLNPSALVSEMQSRNNLRLKDNLNYFVINWELIRWHWGTETWMFLAVRAHQHQWWILFCAPTPMVILFFEEVTDRKLLQTNKTFAFDLFILHIYIYLILLCSFYHDKRPVTYNCYLRSRWFYLSLFWPF